jgi:hypothetical protein
MKTCSRCGQNMTGLNDDQMAEHRAECAMFNQKEV